MASQPLEMKHHAGKGFRVHFASFAQMADLPVLTEHTKEIAISHKDRPGPPGADQWVLFPKMRVVARDHCRPTGTANPLFVRQPVDFTLARAEAAICQNLVRLFYAIAKFPCPTGLYV